LGLANQKQRLGPKLAVAWAREASEKIWDPDLFLQLIEKLVHNSYYSACADGVITFFLQF